MPCTTDCSVLEAPTFGEVSAPAVPLVGSKAIFTCTEFGAQLQGQDTLTCQSSGEWDHDAPVCLSEFTRQHKQITRTQTQMSSPIHI